MRILKLVIVFILIFDFSVYSNDFGNLMQYFANEERAQSMLLINGYAHLNFIGGFADGKYRLKSYSIRPYSRNIYILNIIVEKKKHYFRYVQKYELPFFYNGKIISFKTVKGKRTFRFPGENLEIIKVGNGWRIVKQRAVLKVRIPVSGGSLFLAIKKP